MPRAADVTITDPRILKALAHPARQTLIALLDAGEVFTATEVAERVGLSPSAVSHHLRQLEKFGLAVRAPAARDGRERPWRAASGALNLLPARADPIGRRAVEQIIGRQLELLIRRIENAEAFSTTGPVTGLGRTDLWLTPQELSELQHGLRALLDRTSGRSSRRHPEGAAYHVFLYSLLRDHSGVSAPEAGEPSSGDEQLGDLHGVESGTLAQVVVADEEHQAPPTVDR